MARTAVPHFQTANPLYAGASVTFFTVSGGVKTATKATIYAGETGTTELSNPVTLDGQGRFKTIPWVEVDVIGAVTGLSVPDHDTAIVHNTEQDADDAEAAQAAAEAAQAAAEAAETGAVAAQAAAETAETNAETAATNAATSASEAAASAAAAANSAKTAFLIAVTPEDAVVTTGTAKITFRMPFAMTLTGLRASLKVAQASGSTLTIDAKEGGVSILSTLLTIDNGEKTSKDAAAPAAISDANIADDAEITFDVTQIGDGTAIGLKIVLIGDPA